MSKNASIANRATRGMLWFLGQTTVSRAVQMGAQIVLAWLLAPADFGRIALAYTVTTIVGSVFGLGFGDIVLQRHKAMRFWLGTVFWLGLATGGIGCLALLAAAPLGGLLYNDPHLAGLIAVIAMAAPLNALNTVPNILLRAALRFRALAGVLLGEILGTASLSIVFAALGLGAYSFVLPVPLVALGRAIVLWRLAKPEIARPRAGKRKSRRWLVLLPSATASLGSQVLTTIASQSDYFVLGLLASEVEVGLYYFAFRLSVQPLTMLAGSFGSVLFPTLIQYRLEPVRQRDTALLVAQIMSIVVMPVCFLQAALAGPVIGILFAARWHGAELFVQCLSIGLAFDAASWAAGALMNARGEFRRAFRYSIAFTPVFSLSVLAGALVHGALGVAVAVVCFYTLHGPLFCWLVFRKAESTKLRRVLAIHLIPAPVAAIAVGGGYALTLAIRHSDWFQLLATPPLAMGLYIPLVAVFCPSACGMLKKRILGLRVRDRTASG